MRHDHYEPLDRMVQKLNTHSAISVDDSAALLSLPYTHHHYDPGSYLVREGDAPDQCGVLLTGYAYRHKLNHDGARQIVSIHIPGELLDLQHLFLDVADHNVQTLTACTVANVPRSAFRALARERPLIAHAIFINVLVEASAFREWLLNVGRRDARARVAHLLCEFAIRLDKQGLSAGQEYELPMSQEQLGDALGLTAVHVNRTLQRLVEDGLVTRDKRHVSFPRWEALRDVAQFSSRYLHLAQQPS